MEQEPQSVHDQQSSSTQQPDSSSTPTTRFSARVRAIKQKEQASEPSSSTSTARPSAPTRNRTQSSTAKGKQKDLVRPRRVPSSTVGISEPTRDPKGKKRAAPEPDSSSPSVSEDEIEEQPSSPVKPPPSKKVRITRNSTKVASTTPAPKSTKKAMSRRNKGTNSIAISKARASKAKATAGPSSMQALANHENDIEMMDGDLHDDLSPDDEDMDIQEKHHEDSNEGASDAGNDEPSDTVQKTTASAEPSGSAVAPSSSAVSNLLSGFGDDPSAAAMAMFSGDFRSLGAHMLAQSTKLKSYLAAIKPSSDPTVRFAALQELNELLVMSNEDTLSGYFQVDAFVKELVGILGGKPVHDSEDDDEGGDEDPDDEEDAALAAALTISSGGAFQGDENPEAQVLASRCLYNLMEALPGTAHTVVYHGAVPALCSKLLEIQFIDLAEQNISTLDKISEECAGSVARQGGLPALLNFLDFFNTSVQRTALHAAANCCRNASPDVFKTIREAFPIIRNVLSYPDQRLVESASLCVIRIIESYHRSQPDLLDELLLQDDMALIRAINSLLLPSGGSPVISSSTYTLFLRALSTAAKASSKTTIALHEADIVTTVYQIFTGVLPPSSGPSHQASVSDQGLGGSLGDMAVMENLAHRPKEQVEEALSLVLELMPPLPKEGVFDYRAYSEKALSRLIKSKAKAERAAARRAKSPSPSTVATLVTQDDSTDGADSRDGADSASNDATVRGTSPGVLQVEPPGVSLEPQNSSVAAPVVSGRTEAFRKKPELIIRFMHLMVPALVEVYAASVAVTIRTRAITSLLKTSSFLEPLSLWKVLEFVPMASFIGSILSSQDQQTLVAGALQLVELLLIKLPVEYTSAFQREGVLHEIEAIADRELTPKIKTETPNSTASPSSDNGSVPPAAISTPIRRTVVHVDPADATILRARILRSKYLDAARLDESSSASGTNTFEILRSAGSQLADLNASEDASRKCLARIADLFVKPDAAMSSFELIQSGLVGELLAFATDEGRIVDVNRRQELLLESLTSHPPGGFQSASQFPLVILVKRLQESLTRMESFEVTTVSPTGDDSRRNSASLLARQLRLRLVGEGSDIPKNCSNITVSIHAIATFQALHDYLRPRVSSHGLPSGSRLSGMLAAFAAAAGIPSSALARPPPPSGNTPAPGNSSTNESLPASIPEASSVSSSPLAQDLQEPSKSRKASGSGPRRSQRLSAKGTASAVPEASGQSPSAPPPATQQVGPSEVKPEPIDVDEDDTGFIDADVDAEMFDDDEGHSPANEKTVNLSLADDGDKVVAQTPDGTRITTPNPMRDTALSDTASAARASYASALKTQPSDWHLEFSIEGHPLSLESTIYGAIHQHEARQSSKPSTYLSTIWSNVYTVKFKKAPGPAAVPDGAAESNDRAASPSVAAVPDDSPHSKILRLLRVLHKINEDVRERSAFGSSNISLPETSFINNKLTAKLTRQLEEPMIVASACLPDWAVDLPQHYPFLFPFSTRFSFLQSTSFGYARLILKWQNQQSRASDSSSRRDDTFGYLGRLQRQKVRISRKHLLESAIKVLELYGSSSSVLEVEYFEEVGTGLGPTLEFYSLVSKEFARRNIKMWHDTDANGSGPYVDHPTGLYPAPFGSADIIAEQKTPGKKRTDIFRVLGQFVAKALLDSRIIDMSFSRTFLKLVMGREVPRTIDLLRTIDPALASSLARIGEYAAAQRVIEADLSLSDAQKAEATSSISIKHVTLEDLALDFTVPGYDIELRPGGKDINVDHTNVHTYIEEVLNAFLGDGVELQVKAFREGFSKVFPIMDLRTFSSDEILTIFGNPEEDWSRETLSEALKADHGFNTDSRSFRDLVQVMSSYDASTRREFLQFMTGSPKLPIGGFRGLSPPLTVVRKPHEAPLSPDDYLPSVMTCVNYLKLPAYSSKEVLAAKLEIAMKEGGGSFHLS